MAAVTYRCPVDDRCPTSTAPGFCERHPTAKLTRTRTALTPSVEAEPSPDAEPASPRRSAADGLLAVRILGESVTVPPEGLEVGRDAPHFADLPGMAGLDQVSRRHVRLQYQGDRLLVLDLQSTNGTFVDGRRIRGPESIGPGQRLRLGLDVDVEIEHVRLDRYGLPE